MERNTYTDSAIRGRISKLLESDKYFKIIESFKTNSSGTLLFNPLDDEIVNDIFLQKTEEFPEFVKDTVIEVLGKYGTPDYVLSVLKRQLKIILTQEQTIKLNEWSSKHEGIPISVNCQIIGALKEETYTKSAECYCIKCGHREKVFRNMLPTVCENAECSGRRFVIDESTLVTGDIKTIIIQEPMEEVRHGTPTIKTCVVKDELVFDSYPGQRKKLCGTFRSVMTKGERNKIVINTISMQNLDDENLIIPDSLQLTQFQQMAKKPDYLDKITESFAPEIKFRKLEKMAVIISRIGSKKIGRIRGNIHCLLIGPPATAKSKILEYVQMVTQRSGFATGGMATGAGITVTMTTLPDKTKFPRGGIVVQCSGSCVALDELNQFPEEDIGKTYTAMESGKIPYNKGGFDQIFIADTTIIAGANPKSGYYVAPLGMVKNINLPSPMISRFDIIVNVLPESSSIESQQITDHTNMIREQGIEKFIEKKNLLTAEDLTKLFNYASQLKITITDDAKTVIDDYVKTMMNLQNTGEQEEGAKQFDRRFVESVFRISEAITKLHLQTVMTKEFAVMAIEFIRKTLETFGLKTEKGQIQIALGNEETKDRQLAFEMSWLKMCKDAESEFLPEYDFLKFLMTEYPKLFATMDKASKIFKEKHEKGDLIYQNGRYKMVK